MIYDSRSERECLQNSSKTRDVVLPRDGSAKEKTEGVQLDALRVDDGKIFVRNKDDARTGN